jgi:hypothetical protein
MDGGDRIEITLLAAWSLAAAVGTRRARAHVAQVWPPTTPQVRRAPLVEATVIQADRGGETLQPLLGQALRFKDDDKAA